MQIKHVKMRTLYKTVGALLFGLFLTWGIQNIQITEGSPVDYKKIENVAQKQWIKTDQKFDALSLEFLDRQDEASVQIPGENLPLDFHLDNDDESQRFSPIMIIPPTRDFFISSKGKVTLHLYDSHKKRSTLFAGTTSIGGLKIISREEWGADETLRYNYDASNTVDQPTEETNLSAKETACQKNIDNFKDEYTYDRVVYTENGNALKWPRQYSKKIQKIVVHHTAESEKSAEIPGDSKIRAIYHYHAITRGWGDIGYNYVIDQDGNIYEGRTGGDYVVGAHAFCNNINTLGISLMGNFMKSNPTKAQVAALTKLLKALGTKYGVDISKNSYFHGETTPNLLGHRDTKSTACPGDNLYSLLPLFRKYFNFSDTDFSLNQSSYAPASAFSAVISGNPQVIEMSPLSTRDVSISYKNTGSVAWTKSTWLYANGNDNAKLWTNSILPSKNYVASNLKEAEVPPGGVGHFDITINTGLEGGLQMLELIPILNGERKMNAASFLLTVKIPDGKVDYSFVRAEAPQNPMYYGQHREAKIYLKNTGTIPWYRSGTFAITLAPKDNKDSTFASTENKKILAWMNETTVIPGSIGTFVFDIQSGFKEGTFDLPFVPKLGEAHMLNDVGMKFTLNIKRPNYRAQILYDSGSLIFTPGETKTVRIGLRNMSDVEWQENQISVRVVQDNGIQFSSNSFYFPDFIPQNGSGYVSMNITAPLKAGVFEAKLQVLANDKKFNDARWLYLPISVNEANLDGKITHLSTDTIANEKQSEITLRVKNMGNITWFNNGNNTLYLTSTSEKSELKDKSWMGNSIVGTSDADEVPAGKVATFIFQVSPTPQFTSESFVLRTKSLGTIKNTQFTLRSKTAPIPTPLPTQMLTPLNTSKINQTSTSSISLPDTPNATRESGSSTFLSLFDKLAAERAKAAIKANAKKKIEEQRKTVKPSQNPVIIPAVISAPPVSSSSAPVIQTIKANVASTKNIRILLSFPYASANILSTETLSQVVVDGKLFKTIGPKDALWARKDGNKILISVNGEKIAGDVIRIENTGSFLTIFNWDRNIVAKRKIQDNTFEGTLEFRLDGDKMVVINDIIFDRYLAGMAEIPESEPVEKRKVMAIVARSYARHYMETTNKKFPGKPWDGSDSPAVFQKYIGYGFALRAPNWQQALKDTTNEVVTYNGEILRTAYFSCSDGRTKTPTEAKWTQGYFQQVKDVFQSVDDTLGKDMDRFNKGQCGHGVGLSGLGTHNMALAGKTYDEILHYYYQNVTIEKK